MKRSTSPDCSFIGQSLKRVKISTSPGELRLDRDIEQLLNGTTKQWTSTVNNDINNQGSSWGRGTRIHSELYCNNARLIRDPVDPLRLRLTCLHQPISTPPQNNNFQHGTQQHLLSHSSSSSPIPPERWTYLIQMPRMYPHSPPLITRVTRDNDNETYTPLGNIVNVQGDSYYNSVASVSSSSIQYQMEPPMPEQVLINPLPPTPNGHTNQNNNGTSKLLDLDLATCVCNTWTPVSSLQDLIDFLIQIPSKRREWWSIESNRLRHQEQKELGLQHTASPQRLASQSVSALNSTSPHRQQEQQVEHQHYQWMNNDKNQQQQDHHFTPPSEMDDEDMSIMMEEQQRNDDLALSQLSGTNRFNVGYDRTRSDWNME